MTRHISVLGIDGSGKSTLTRALPAVLAATTLATVGGAGARFRIAAKDEDHVAPGFLPDGLPPSAHLARLVKRVAKAFTRVRALYPFLKLAHMLLQDRAARVLARRHGAAMFVSDGNALLCAAGRAGNYLYPASDGSFDAARAPTGDDIARMARWIERGGARPRKRLPGMRLLRVIQRVSGWLGVRAMWLPDDVVFLDVTPEAALARIRARGRPVDAHENPHDLAQARRAYLAALEAIAALDGGPRVHVVRTEGKDPAAVLAAVLDALLPEHAGERASDEERTLGTTDVELDGTALWAKVVNPRYLFGYLTARFFDHAWREPLFAFSKDGRLFLREGYSAACMRVIYEREGNGLGFFSRAFHDYPLHRAVYDRLQILKPTLEEELRARLASGGRVRAFTAPSGYAWDLLGALERIALDDPDAASRVDVLAADLDPHDELTSALGEHARRLGVTLTFLRGDITSDELRERVRVDARQNGRFDVAVYVGLSSWLDKPGTLAHVRLLREVLHDEGVLVSDCFTPASYALSGRYVGYKASYFEPDVYLALLSLGGFSLESASVTSGRDGINHVVVTKPRPQAPERSSDSAWRCFSPSETSSVSPAMSTPSAFGGALPTLNFRYCTLESRSSPTCRASNVAGTRVPSSSNA